MTATKNKILVAVERIRAAPNEKQTLKIPGAVVVVREGGFPGVRLFFDQDVETFPGERSEEAVDGAAYARDWDVLYVRFPAIVGPVDLVLEVWRCATPVFELRQGIAEPQAVRYVAQIDEATEIPDSNTTHALLYTQVAALPAAELGDEALRRLFFSHDAWIGGSIVCSQPFDLRFWALQPNTAVRAEIAKIANSTADADGKYSASFETGMARSWVTGATPGNQVPWPRLGLALSIKHNTGATLVTVDSLLLYARGR